jgi:hypothetical protein
VIQLGPVLISRHLGCFMVHSYTAQKIQANIQLANPFTYNWAIPVSDGCAFADASKHIRVPAGLF